MPVKWPSFGPILQREIISIERGEKKKVNDSNVSSLHDVTMKLGIIFNAIFSILAMLTMMHQTNIDYEIRMDPAAHRFMLVKTGDEPLKLEDKF